MKEGKPQPTKAKKPMKKAQPVQAGASTEQAVAKQALL